jgi:hypothetical protein
VNLLTSGGGGLSQNHDSSIEVKMSDPVITLYTSKNVQSPQKLLEQLAKEKGFMNSPIIIVENISKVTSSASMSAGTMNKVYMLF